LTVGAGLLAILLLIILGYAARGIGQSGSGTGHAPSPWVVGIAALLLGFPWYALMGFVFTPKQPHIAFGIPMAAGVAWAVLVYLLFFRWTTSQGWGDLQRWSLSFAATLVCMVAGFLGTSAWLKVDMDGKIILNIIAVAGFFILLARIRQHETRSDSGREVLPL
jgi:hypothetical protein